MKKFCGKSETSVENPKVLQKLKRILRKIAKFCGTFGFSAEDLDFLQKIRNFYGKTETSADCTPICEEPLTYTKISTPSRDSYRDARDSCQSPRDSYQRPCDSYHEVR